MLRRLVKRSIYQRKTITFKIYKRVCKINWGASAKFAHREVALAKWINNPEHPANLWKPWACVVKSVVAWPKLVVISSQRLPQPASIEEIDTALGEFLNSLDNALHLRPWTEVIEPYFNSNVLPALDNDLSEKIERELAGVLLPESGAHGDLCDRHFLKTSRGEIKVIDWEYFNPHGSYVLDLLRLLMAREVDRLRLLQGRSKSLSQLNPSVMLNVELKGQFASVLSSLTARQAGLLAALAVLSMPEDKNFRSLDQKIDKFRKCTNSFFL